MNKQVCLGQQVVSCDRESTVELYVTTIKTGGADKCDCTYCKNFAAQRTTVYPPGFLALLEQLGANSLKELEAFDYDFGPTTSKRHLYGGWFVFCGELTEGTEWRPDVKPGLFTCWFTTSFPNAAFPKHPKLCAVEFCTEIPWVISERPERTQRE
jgi:hypothetical protein